ncbi:hypothetical protein [Streptomyces niveiscabiei]|uniref:Uncharacterized protein n=1 Tax=Streptomyces niveiscabiei TaxID=164115 RepID=A0ABW9I2J6_9ACTN
MTTPAPAPTPSNGQQQSDPGTQPAPAPPAPPAPQQQPAPEPAPAAPATPAPAPAEQQPPQPAPAPAVEGDLSRLPQWAQRAITESQTAARSAAVQNAVYQTAPAAGADPLALLDSMAFRAAADAIDPTDTAALTAAITAAVTANPRLAAVQAQGPARGGAEFNGPPAGEKRPATLADAIAARYSN